MKNYRDALLALDLTGTHTSKQNKFTKIAHTTEDPILKELCLEVAKWWGWYLKRGWTRDTRDKNTGEWHPIIPTGHDKWKEGQQIVNQKLREYCEMVLSQAKPEWMRLAEKHGWRPPN